MILDEQSDIGGLEIGPGAATSGDIGALGLGTPSEQMPGIFQQTAQRAQAQVNRPTSLVGMSRQQADAVFAQIPSGRDFIDPQGQVRTKPRPQIDPNDPERSFAAIPEGAEFTDPEGEIRVKPKYEAISNTAQVLVSMAQTDDAKEQALRVIYGDKVKQDESGEFYVEDEGGVLRKPGARDIPSTIGMATSELLPAIGMIGGAAAGGLGGAAAGSVIPGPGTVAGALTGSAALGMAGAALGRQFNNTILALYGVKQSAGQQLSSAAWEAAMAGGGEVAGKAIQAVVGRLPLIKQATGMTGYMDWLKENAGRLNELIQKVPYLKDPETFKRLSGLTAEDARLALSIAEQEGKVSPSILHPGFPMLHLLEKFDVVFAGHSRFEKEAEKFANQQATKLLENEALGIKVTEPPTKATAAVSSKEAGEGAIEAVRRDYAYDSAQLANAVADVQKAVRAPITEMGGEKAVSSQYQQALDKLNALHLKTTQDASALVKSAANDLRNMTDEAIKLSKAGDNPDALHRMVDAGFDILENRVRSTAKTMYGAAREVAKDAPVPNVSSLAQEAESFLRSMPEAMRGKYPREIADLARLVDRDVSIPGIGDLRALKQGEVELPVDWADLHHLRSWLRHGIDYADRTPDMRQGSLKYFEQKINAVLHDAKAHPQLQAATTLLDQADAFYAREIPFLKDAMVKNITDKLKSGEGVNPNVVADIFFNPDRTAAMQRVRRALGESLWKDVETAHVDHLLNRSKTMTGEIDLNKLAPQILEEVRNGLINTAYSPGTASTLKKLGEQAELLGLKGELPIQANEGDTLVMLLRKGAVAKKQADELAATDPLKALSDSLTKVDKKAKVMHDALLEQRKSDPLAFLGEDQMKHMAVEAADTILKSPDLLMAAAAKFERTSPEFVALQRVYAQRFLQRPLAALGQMRQELSSAQKGMTEELQQLMFPGVTRDMMVQLAKELEFMTGSRGLDFGASLAGTARVANPERHMPFKVPSGVVGRFLVGFPGVAQAHRVLLGQFYEIVMEAMSHPNMVYFLNNAVRDNTAFKDKQLLRRMFREHMTPPGHRPSVAGTTGAAVSQVEGGGPTLPEKPEEDEAPPAVTRYDAQGNRIPGREEGGDVEAGKPYVVGEQGPEVVVPQQSGTVLPEGFVEGAGVLGSNDPTIRALEDAAVRRRRQQSGMVTPNPIISDEMPYPVSAGQQYAMADENMRRGKPPAIQGGGSSGGSVPTAAKTTAQPEIMPPSRSMGRQPAELDWTKPLLDIGYHPRQLANMTPQEIQMAGIKVVQTRLGPMAKPLQELGYTPQQMINMTPKDAYQAIFKSNKVLHVETPVGPARGWLGEIIGNKPQ